MLEVALCEVNICLHETHDKSQSSVQNILSLITYNVNGVTCRFSIQLQYLIRPYTFTVIYLFLSIRKFVYLKILKLILFYSEILFYSQYFLYTLF